MKLGNNHGTLTATKRKRLGNVPLRWRYDGTKLFMLFREGACSYLIVQRAELKKGENDEFIAVSQDGGMFILKNGKRSERLAA